MGFISDLYQVCTRGCRAADGGVHSRAAAAWARGQNALSWHQVCPSSWQHGESVHSRLLLRSWRDAETAQVFTILKSSLLNQSKALCYVEWKK